jgi:glycosyltransferase involved in cell wall biosynthesis
VSRPAVAGIADTIAIRQAAPADILAGDTRWIRDRFRFRPGTSVPVIIPARDEQHDLPATLLALARSTCDVTPVVVDNNSADNTAAIARRLGAHVVTAPAGAKMAATQAGLAYAAASFPRTGLLFTDADTLVLPGWAAAMRSRLARESGPRAGPGVLLFGPVLCWHGQRRYVDAALTVIKISRSAARSLTARPPVGRGANYGLHPDRGGLLAAALGRLDPDLLDGDDTAIRDAGARSGARVTVTYRLSACVITRNDRYPTLTSRFGPRRDTVRRASYRAQYRDHRA